jgi:hypothetical protein
MFDDALEVTEDADLQYSNLCQLFVRLQQAMKAEIFGERLQKHTMTLYDGEGSSSQRQVEKSFDMLYTAFRRAEINKRTVEFGDLYKEFGFADDLIDAIGRATFEISAETRPAQRESDQYQMRRRLSHAGSERSMLSMTSKSEESVHSEG